MNKKTAVIIMLVTFPILFSMSLSVTGWTVESITKGELSPWVYVPRVEDVTKEESNVTVDEDNPWKIILPPSEEEFEAGLPEQPVTPTFQMLPIIAVIILIVVFVSVLRYMQVKQTSIRKKR